MAAGTGRYTSIIQNYSEETVIGIDISPNMIETA